MGSFRQDGFSVGRKESRVLLFHTKDGQGSLLTITEVILMPLIISKEVKSSLYANSENYLIISLGKLVQTVGSAPS